MGIYIAIGVALLVGVVMLFFAVKKFIETIVFIRASKKTEGLIIGQATSRNSDGQRMYMPVVEFITKGDKAVRFASTIASNPPSYKIGDRTCVRYHVKNPQSAKIDSFGEMWLVTLILSVIGLASLVAAFLMFRAR